MNRRPFHDPRHPVHVVLRAVAVVGNLRRRRVYQAIREATRVAARREDFRIVHLSIQRTHVHLLVEANGNAALAAGMQGFQISAAKHLNAAISSGGRTEDVVAARTLEEARRDLVPRSSVGSEVVAIRDARAVTSTKHEARVRSTGRGASTNVARDVVGVVLSVER